MTLIDYEDFVLQIRMGSSDSDVVTVLQSPYGGGEGKMSFPFALADLQQILTKLEASMINRWSRDATSRDLAGVTLTTCNAQDIEALGAALFDALFPSSVLQDYLISRGKVEATETRGLRLRLIIDQSSSEFLLLNSLPWELLYYRPKRDFLSLNPLSPVVRYPNVTQRDANPISHNKLRVLVAMATPVDAPSLDLALERERIEAAWGRSHLVEVDFLEHATLSDTDRRLRDSSFHVLHFMGHGYIDKTTEEGSLVFAGASGKAHVISAEIIAEHLRSIRSLRLIFLNACNTARFPRMKSEEAHTSIAAALTRRQIPAVIAMQFPILDTAAAEFSDVFYSSLASGHPVEAAVAEGRLRLLTTYPKTHFWATPVLFSCTRDGRLFVPEPSEPKPASNPTPQSTLVMPSSSKSSSLPSYIPRALDRPFADREHELSRLTDILSAANRDKPRVEVWYAQPASGLSHFLRHSATLLRSGGIVMYGDCSNQAPNSVFAQIIVYLFNHYISLWHEFVSFVRLKTHSDRTRSLTRAALIGIPYVGQFLAPMTAGDAPALETSHFPSAVAELICEFLTTLAARFRLLVLLDNAQDIDSWSLDLLVTTISKAYGTLSYVLAFVAREENTAHEANKLVLRTLQTSYSVERFDFSSPTSTFAMRLGTFMHLALGEADAAALVAASEGSIYRLLSGFQQRLSSSPLAEGVLSPQGLSELEEEIVRLIALARQAMRRSDILAICLRNPIVLVDHESRIDAALQRLRDSDFVEIYELPDGDGIVSLAGVDVPLLARATTLPYTLITAERLYSYFSKALLTSRRHSHSELVPLLYRLSKIVDTDSTPRLAQRVLALSMTMGSIGGAERFVDRATGGGSIGGTMEVAESFSDYIVKAVFYLATRSYRHALVLLDSPINPLWSRYRSVMLLRAIALNRNRLHEEADRLCDKLIATSDCLEETTLLAAYKIAGRLHMNDLDTARQIFQKCNQTLRAATNYGYFLRNAASAFKAPEAAELLKFAIDIFKINEDLFGYATSLSNRATDLFLLDERERALLEANEAYTLLETFGIHHLHLVANNLGIFSFAVGKVADAEKWFWRSLSLSKTTMPTVFTKINLAFLYAMTERKNEALRLIDDLEPQVIAYPVDRMKQRFYVNAALIMFCVDRTNERVAEYCREAAAHPDRKYPVATQRKVEKIRAASNGTLDLARSEIENLFTPCSLAYWYQNPFESLPPHVLTSEAVFHDVTN